MFEVTKITNPKQVNELIASLNGKHPFCVVDDKYFIIYKGKSNGQL